METLLISAESFKVGFIGAGKMAESTARGVVASRMLPPNRNSTAVHSNLNRRQVFESFGVNVFSSSEEVVKESDVVIFSVKPQEWSGQDRFVRVMPNTPAAVGEAASGSFSESMFVIYYYHMLTDDEHYVLRKIVMSLGTAATEEDGALVAKLFGFVGKMFKADEKMFDVVTGLIGSGPAYIFLAIEALADGGVAAGLPRELALGLASQTVLGGATMVSKTGKHPGVLKDDVTTPGGTTIARVHELEKGSWSCNNGEQNG
ncbi:unnamed protein product [Brassica oleracea var. botrytis]|uniref:Pyrroline-5-carboxylate reductase n=1 Tax=Brassica carinata TaxID=52824 RepID=A0A8X7Q6F6_BRACI|nr:hypothetical protein Bca52824_071027 [Brassica carinata]